MQRREKSPEHMKLATFPFPRRFLSSIEMTGFIGGAGFKPVAGQDHFADKGLVGEVDGGHRFRVLTPQPSAAAERKRRVIYYSKNTKF